MVLYKYVSEARIDILQTRLIRFTQPNALNDPFEARFNFDQKERYPDLSNRLYKEVYNRVGILSLSEIHDNLLMWAHYTEGHTGFVLMLDGSHDFFKGDYSSPSIAKGFAKPERVEYSVERPQVSIEYPPTDILLFKSSDWKYEKEWRYLKHLKDADKRHEPPDTHSVDLFRLPPECIVGVILGCYRSEELKNNILRLQRDDLEFRHLRIQQAFMSDRYYRLIIKEI